MDNPNRQLVPIPQTPAPLAPVVIDDAFIKSRIFTIRGMQVMLDRDLAVIYGVETKALNQAVKRNAERFPESFMFRLSSAEAEKWKSQIVTSNLTPKEEAGLRMGLRRPPYAFTEQGIAMLSAVLKSRTAVLVSVRIMEIFVAMRRAFVSMAPMLARLDTVERRQITDQARNEERFDTIFKAMDGGDFPPQKVFFDGQVYDAFEQMKRFVRMAKTELIVIDPYFDDSVLPLVAQKRSGVSVLVVRNSRNKQLHAADVAAFNAQYGNSLAVKISDRFHDRFLILDRFVLIHVGASLNHLGKRCFAFSSLDKSNIPDILAKI